MEYNFNNNLQRHLHYTEGSIRCDGLEYGLVNKTGGNKE